jgi:DNA-binding MarR family transcriptional regulator
MEVENEQVEMELEQIFRRLLRKMVAYGKYVDKGFSGSQAAALEVIQNQGSIKVTQLAECLTLSMSAVTLLCDRLIDNNYVIRKRSHEDRRVVCLQLTAQGKDMLKQILDAERKLVGQWLAGLHDNELCQFNRMFQHIIKNAQSVNHTQ